MAATASRQPVTTNNQPAPHGDPARPAPPQPATANTGAKKSKGKKNTDPVDTSKLVNDTIAQLERNQGREKSEEQEIEREVKKANRDLSQQLSTIQSPMQKVETVVKKYSELYAEMKRAERDYIKSKKRGDALQKEKDQAKSEGNKAQTKMLTLEKLSRDFERDNKKLRDENRRLQESETQKRDELHERLEAMALEVSQTPSPSRNNKPSSSTDTGNSTLEQDALFRTKFKSFVDQYDLREIQFQSLLRVKDLELAQLTQQLTSARQQTDSESLKSRQLTSQVSTFSQTETELRGQLNVYVDKFKQVEETLNNSNDLFLTFRKEMEEMSKKTKRLEKENHNLSRKQALTNQNIATMAQDRIRLTGERDGLKRKTEELERLCRGMQAQGRGGEDVEKRLQEVQQKATSALAAAATATTHVQAPASKAVPRTPSPTRRVHHEPKTARTPSKAARSNGDMSSSQMRDADLAADEETATADEDDEDEEEESDYEYEEAESSEEEDSTDDEEYEEDDTEDLRGELAGLSKDAAFSPKRIPETPPTQSPGAKAKSKSPEKTKVNGKVNGVR